MVLGWVWANFDASIDAEATNNGACCKINSGERKMQLLICKLAKKERTKERVGHQFANTGSNDRAAVKFSFCE